MRDGRIFQRTSHTRTRLSHTGVWGSSVNNLQGERIGVITEVVIDRDRTKVVFVIIRLDDDFAATPGTRIAVRWSLLRLNLNVRDRSAPYLLDLTRRQLRIAPRLDRSSFNDLCAREIGDGSRAAVPRLLRLPVS